MLLSLLLDNIGRSFKNEDTKKRLEDVFVTHLLCPYPILCLIKHYELSDEFLEKRVLLPKMMIPIVRSCPQCYVPRELNSSLTGQFTEFFNSLPFEGTFSSFAGYSELNPKSNNHPDLPLDEMQKTVDAVIPEDAYSVKKKDKQNSLYIRYTEDFRSFQTQFDSMDLTELYKYAFKEDPPLPLLGGKPTIGDRDYAEKMECYIDREQVARIGFAQLIYHRTYKWREPETISETLKELFARK